MSSRHLWITKP